MGELLKKAFLWLEYKDVRYKKYLYKNSLLEMEAGNGSWSKLICLRKISLDFYSLKQILTRGLINLFTHVDDLNIINNEQSLIRL